MWATWKFRACKLRSQYSWIQRKGACNTISGTERDAWEFSRRCVEHFRGHDVVCVEAWSVGPVEGAPDDVPGLLTFKVVPHENGKDWQAVPCALQHALWITKLEHGIDYMMFRGGGKLCRVHVVNQAGGLERVVLADRRGKDSCPCTGPSACGKV
jgi:hypothetical protein